MKSIDGKIALVTGASGGIGSAIARQLASEGCKVALASRSTDKLKQLQSELKSKYSAEVMVLEMDVTKTYSVMSAVEQLTNEWGCIDFLINNAGVMPLSYLKNRHLEEWLNTIDVNVKGVMNCVYASLPSMKDKKSGHIVNIASVDGKELFEGGAIYGASKAAIIAFSKAMRMELSPEFNIRVSCLEPGTVDTDLRDDITDEELLEDKDYGGDEPKLQPVDIAYSVIFALKQPDRVNLNEILIKPTGKS